MKKLEIRLADKSEIDIAFTLLKGAALWLKDRKIDYWQNWLNPPDLHVDWIREGFDSNQFYFVMSDLKVIGMFRLQWSDEKFWGVQDDNAGYIHSLTTDRAYHGQGLGQQILSMVENLCKEHDKKYLRLDCGVHLDRLCSYYENFGFVPVGEVIVNSYRLMLYEKRLSV